VSWGERLSAMDRVQQSTRFKIIASVVVGLVGLGALIALLVVQAQATQEVPTSQTAAALAEIAKERREQNATSATNAASAANAASATGTNSGASGVGKPAPNAEAMLRDFQTAYERLISDLRAAQNDRTSTVFMVVASTGVALVIVWAGLGLTFLALGVVGAGVVVPLLVWGGAWMGGGGRALGVMLGGALTLLAAFTAMVRAAQLALSHPSPVFAIARNVVTEAVRKRVSVGLLVAMLLAVAAIPLLLQEGQELRYRVQMFLQYGTGVSFLIACMVVLFLGVSSVGSEQRDRVIWATWVKPVRAWQYVLGKWIGVTLVGGILLSVCTCGVFLFTEYLRNQRATDEVRAFVIDPNSPDKRAVRDGISTDRSILEYQVLTARQVVPPTIRQVDARRISEEIERRYKAEFEALKRNDPDPMPPDRDRIRREVDDALLAGFFTIPRNGISEFIFPNVGEARTLGRPIALRVKVSAGAANVGSIVNLGIRPMLSQNPAVEGDGRFIPTPEQSGEDFARVLARDRFVQTVTPGVFSTIALFPTAISENGTLRLDIANLGPEPDRAMMFQLPDGMQLIYPVDTFANNFLRGVLILWCKLAFLGALAICASSFLNLPTAALVASSCFLFAEGSTFIGSSLGYWSFLDEFHQSHVWWRYPVYYIAWFVSWIFSGYGTLQPVDKLAEGLNIQWSTVWTALGVVGAMTLGLVGLSTLVMSRREMGVYSGR
jgi:hypothetical protein